MIVMSSRNSSSDCPPWDSGFAIAKPERTVDEHYWKVREAVHLAYVGPIQVASSAKQFGRNCACPSKGYRCKLNPDRKPIGARLLIESPRN